KSTEELASILESDGSHYDRNLDDPLTLKIMDSNVEINSLNDADEQESTVVIEPVDRTFDDNSTPNEPVDHTFDEHSVEESVNRDTETIVESLNNFDEINPLNIVKTENTVVQSAEEIASADGDVDVRESQQSVVIHDDSNLDNQPITNVERNGFIDYIEQDDTVVSVANIVQDHDIRIEDQHDEVETIDEIAESPVDSDNIVESKPQINNTYEDDEGDTSIVAENGQGDDSSASEMVIPRSRNLYIPPIQDPRTFLITGRNDGASSHFIPIFRQNSKDLSKTVVSFFKF
uniref:Zinc finger protein n=1 Tax=Panagrolaimus sp. PS1159 TaxID=55785 RepID=A0AC35GLB6_9BILA